MKNPFRYFKTSPEVIRLAVMMYIRFPLSLRQVEDLLNERGIDICHETVRAWWNRFGPMFAAEIDEKRSASMRAQIQWRWHLGEVFVRINGETHYLWRAVDHEGEVLEVFVTKKRDRQAALRFLRKTMKRFGRPGVVVTDRLRSYRAAMREIGNEARQVFGQAYARRIRKRRDPAFGVWHIDEVFVNIGGKQVYGAFYRGFKLGANRRNLRQLRARELSLC
jgi:putative transposase